MDSIQVMQMVISFFQEYPVLIVIIASVIGVEPLIFLAFLSGQGFISFWIVFVFGLISLLFIDAGYFFLGKRKFLHRYIWSKIKKKGYLQVFHRLGVIAHNNQFYFLLISKYIYFLRQMTVLYLGHKIKRYRDFAKNDTPALLIFMVTFIPLAWLAGQGVLISFGSIKKIEIGIALCILFIFTMYEISRLIVKRLLK